MYRQRLVQQGVGGFSGDLSGDRRSAASRAYWVVVCSPQEVKPDVMIGRQEEDRKLKNVEHVENWHASGSLMVLARRYPKALRTNTPHFWAPSRLELQHYQSHSSYLSSTTTMASSSFFNLDNGTTRAPSRSSSDMQPEIGSIPFQKSSHPFTYPAVLSPSAKPSKGIFVPLTPLMQISPSNPYAEQDFSLELYERVSAHVVHMQEHPYEKTLEYRVSRVRIVCRGYLARFKARVSRRVRVFLASARRHSLKPLPIDVASLCNEYLLDA
ncbi:hypothetical protein AGABI2DRAFT_178786 [Agaricus bisporus var. bisporus H97]|uniref:hypothetical protein n=1 Tax=Agaricus bisporus var. bisporus (strain H97 / ATCC MYA-4626 / FGSC 10389) TaxID=936046 RepID=UPI00029F8023|nr:hypothetical protein AGABI2DRAFT_178786 [Agaricus bisporus var. bisporus H97]EKV46433.1 hypothetical protein AGABI2DRAFT_178786 [Agaricus bisporus var. bisporus H97]